MKPYNVELGKDGGMHLIPNNPVPEAAPTNVAGVRVQRVDGRACVTQNVEERKWWAVEETNPRTNKWWKIATRQTAEEAIAYAAKCRVTYKHIDGYRSRAVEVVERKLILDPVEAGSSIAQAERRGR